MPKRKNLQSEIIDVGCVKPARKAKKQALKKGDLNEATVQALKENYCIIQREKAKTTFNKPTKNR